MARKYNMTKRLEKAYENYSKRYDIKEAQLAKKGYNMVSRKLTKTEYFYNREAYVNEGVKTNINQTLVSEQAYEYNLKTARRFKETAKKFDLDWKDLSVSELMKGKKDVSEINNYLMEIYPDWTGVQRAEYISHEVFGSD